jgi:hypothetical protein
MDYFFDTEFIQGFHKPLFGKRRFFIDLISIGIVAADGREYYAISNEYDYKDADEWVRKNVIIPMFRELPVSLKQRYEPHNFNKYVGKSNKLISEEIKKFCGYKYFEDEFNVLETLDTENFSMPEFYAYYADYDWVLLCSLFGSMMDLPHEFPRYCKDLKQMFDEKQKPYLNSPNPVLANYKLHEAYPKQINEHNALDDAKWNKKLYEFIKDFRI